jgi:hypothetical protein
MNDDNFETRIKAHLESSAQNLDGETKRRLLEIRRGALNQPTKLSWFKSHQWMPAAGLAFCSIIAIMLYLPSQQSPLNGNASAIDQTAMLELIDSTDDIDTLSDPGFYLWLDETTGT